MKLSLDAGIMGALTRVGNVVATSARGKAKTRRIAKAITLDKSKSISNGEFAIDIYVRQADAPEFMAYEKGSGLHRTVGTPSKYIIEPDTATRLAFPFTITYMPGMKLAGGKIYGTSSSRGQISEELDNSGEVSLEPGYWRYVEHPGVKPEPAMEPAFRETRREVGETLRYVFGKDITAYLMTTRSPNA